MTDGLFANADTGQLPLRDESVDLIFTDPPYHKKYRYLYSWLAREASRVLKIGGFCLAMCGGGYLTDNMEAMSEYLTWFYNYEVYLADYGISMIWPKRIQVKNKPLLAFSKGIGKPKCVTLSIFHGDGNDKRFHKWGQDAGSARYYIECFSNSGDIVLDPLCGGGTYLLVAGALGREAIGFDVDFESVVSSRNRFVGYEPVPMPKQGLLWADG